MRRRCSEVDGWSEALECIRSEIVVSMMYLRRVQLSKDPCPSTSWFLLSQQYPLREIGRASRGRVWQFVQSESHANSTAYSFYPLFRFYSILKACLPHSKRAKRSCCLIQLRFR